jgi:predicted phage terminase large subunit-like protein
MEDNGLDTINMCHRGIAKSTLKEYLILYLAVYGELPNFGLVPYALYISDSIDNGVKKMRKNLEFRWENSEFLQKYVPRIQFTDIRWEFENIEGRKFVVSGYGAKTGVRGTRELGTRPVLALLDDLISDEDARSATVLSKVEDTVYKAIDYALHPNRRKIIWSGTPFNAKDPLYKAVESGAWNVNVFPVCENFPCSEEDFRGSWPDRFDYKYVMKQYTKAKKSGLVETFNQELMLRIMSDEDRLIRDSDIMYYQHASITHNKERYNFYITTDFATSEEEAADYSVISVWAYNNNGDWFWVDGVCRTQTMDKNIEDLFRLVQEYRPKSVGVEVSGQQGGFISWIQREMGNYNTYFHLASENNKGVPGVRPVTKKLVRFQTMVPMFKQHKVFFPSELLGEAAMRECMEELTLVSKSGFKSKHDDFIDTVSMLSVMTPWKPSIYGSVSKNSDGIYELEEMEEYDNDRLSSYIY